MIIIDGKGLVMGRLASYVAKKAKEGEKVTVLNAEKVIITGKKTNTFEKYKSLDDKSPRNKQGVTIPKRPDLFLKRVIRGMVGRKKSSGRDAYRNVRCFMGVPESMKDKKVEKTEIKSKKDVKIRDVATIEEVCNYLGYAPKNRKR